MTIEIITTDGLGINALLGAARELDRLLDGRNIILGVVDGKPLGQETSIAVITAARDAGSDGSIMVTIEDNPRVLRQVADPEPDPAPHRPAQGGRTHLVGSVPCCICTARCCNNAAGDCICHDCRDPEHDHER